MDLDGFKTHPSRNKTKRPRLQIERGRRPPSVKAHERILTSP